MGRMDAQGPLRESSWEAVVHRAVPCEAHTADYKAGRTLPFGSGCGCLTGEQAAAMNHPDLESNDLGFIARWHKNPLVRLRWRVGDLVTRR